MCSSMAAPWSPSTCAAGSNRVVSSCKLRIFFAMLLKHAFGTSREGIYLHTRSDDALLNLSRLRAKTKVRKALIRDMLFADNAALATHTQRELQSLMDHFSQASRNFGLTISRKRPTSWDKVPNHHQSSLSTNMSSMRCISSHTLAPLSLTTSPWTQSLIRISKAAATFACLITRVSRQRRPK